MEAVGYLAAGLIGVTLGLMGGGGSILTVPVLVYLFGASAQTATGYSLFIVGVTAAIGAALMARSGLVVPRAAALFALPAFVSVWLTRRLLVPALPEAFGPLTRDQALLLLFAALMLVTAVSMLRRPESVGASPESAEIDARRLVPPALAVGVVTGLVGAGGGFLIVPALTLAARLPMKRAVGTSLAVIAANSLVGFLADTQVRPHADWRFLLLVTGAAVAGMAAGTALARRIPGARLRPAFAVFLLAMGAYMVGRELFFESFPAPARSVITKAH